MENCNLKGIEPDKFFATLKEKEKENAKKEVDEEKSSILYTQSSVNRKGIKNK